jgi:predicted nucleotidyltransferase
VSRASKKSLLALYWRTANAFAGRARQQLGDAVHSVVLYGSVARDTAEEDSDIDVLVLSDNGEAVRHELVDISESLDFENNYDTFLVATCFTPERLRELARGEFPIARHILREGVVLYDDGTFERIRKDAVAVGGGNVG